jgi:myo-inositol-1(or 4)-monophosphatase
LSDQQGLAAIDVGRVREVAVSAATAAGALLLARMNSIREVRHKGAVDLVTDVDLASEQLVCSTLMAAFPTHTVVGEEGGAREGSDPRYRWYVDPLDGTTNYTHGFPFFSVSIAFAVNGTLTVGAVYAPYLNELFEAYVGGGATLNGSPIRVSDVRDLRESLLATGFPYDRGAFDRALHSFDVLSKSSQAVRRAGSAALDLCYVACGRFDGYWEHMVSPWDVAAGALVVLESGGQVSGTDGSPFDHEAGQVLASNKSIHPALAGTLARI